MLKYEQNLMDYKLLTILNFHFAFEMNLWPYDDSTDFTYCLFGAVGAYCLFGAVNLTKNSDPDKYSYCGYGIGFHMCGLFSCSDGTGLSKNVMTFGDDNISSGHTDNRKKHVLILRKCPTDRLCYNNRRS